MKTLRCMVGLVGLGCVAGCASAPVAEVPSDAIHATPYGGWRHAFKLENASATVVVVPEAGRVMHLGLRDGGNVLRNDPELSGKRPPEDASWANHGGEWLWPVAQSRWSGLKGDGRDWPPPDAIRDAPWEGRAWREPDGAQCCVLTRRYGPPVNAIAMRHFTLHPGQPLLTVRQSMVATADSGVPLTFWSVAQIDKADEAFFPVRADSAFEKGYKLMMGDAPPGPMKNCGEVLACALVRDQMSKLGTDAPVPWIAARKYDVVTVVRADSRFSGDLPDGGCSLQLFVLGRNQYAEIETLSPEFHLLAGESLGNTLTIELMRVPPGMSPCRIVDRLRPEEK